MNIVGPVPPVMVCFKVSSCADWRLLVAPAVLEGKQIIIIFIFHNSPPPQNWDYLVLCVVLWCSEVQCNMWSTAYNLWTYVQVHNIKSEKHWVYLSFLASADLVKVKEVKTHRTHSVMVIMTIMLGWGAKPNVISKLWTCLLSQTLLSLRGAGMIVSRKICIHM